MPTNVSWLKRIEGHFAANRYFTLDGTDHVTHSEQARMIRRYIAWATTTLSTRSIADS